jgi:hypothetical protein
MNDRILDNESSNQLPIPGLNRQFYVGKTLKSLLFWDYCPSCNTNALPRTDLISAAVKSAKLSISVDPLNSVQVQICLGNR